ncbi:carbohydrate ABC transporter permease [Glycomyces sp. NPDC048151]|uniref:carbohydrate ABC transporter permease n=1 Tax=Glycomyces sp. NPDC048151 TaxID=3364002 RepID=UPI00371B8B1E
MALTSNAETETETEEAPRSGRRAPRRSSTRVHDTLVDRVFMTGVYILLTTFMLVILVPLVNIVANSFSSPNAVNSGEVFLWPVEFTTIGYETVLSDPQILRGFMNSFLYTVGGTLLSLILTVAIAYPLSRRELVGRKAIITGILFTMLFAGGLIPMYLVVQSLGMLNTRWALIVPGAIGAWQVLIAMTFFQSQIPDSLYEAAELDGASDFRILWSVVLPLSKPLLAVIALMYAVGTWNSYFDALIYLRDPDLYPLQLVLRNILILNTQVSGLSASEQLEMQKVADLMKYALIVVSTVPVLLVYPFVARHFTKGVMIGAVKG